MIKIYSILTFTFFTLLFSATPSFSFLYDGIHWDDSDLPVRWEINQDGTANRTEEYELLIKV